MKPFREIALPLLKKIALLSAVLLVINISAGLTHAKVILNIDEEGTNNADTLTIDADDSSTDFIKLKFGTALDAYLQYDIVADEFDFNENVNFNQNEAKSFVLEKGTSFPVSPVTGQKFFRTDTIKEYTYTGSGGWVTVATGSGATGDFLSSNSSDSYTGTGTLTFESGTKIDLDAAAVELDGISDNTFTLDEDDDATTFITLEFGDTLSKTIAYDLIDDEFEMNVDLSLKDNELVDFRIENLSAAPTCSGSVLGKRYFNTVTDASFVCTSGGWVRETNTIASTTAKEFFVDIDSGVRGSMALGTVAGGNSAIMRADPGGNSRVRWSFPIPKDWSSTTDIIVEIYWSPSNTDTGDVRWEFDYAAKAEGETISGGDFATILATPSAPGTTLELETQSFTMPGATFAVDDMINIHLNRDGGDAADTFTGDVNIHMVRIKYTGT